MADFGNLSEINENFDTIKALLNSIRAQGILNTSDVDKLLSGINSKLEKINTEEDIDLIKIFLSELKQNLDERYNVLVSKFGAIESLFSNLLKNSSEMPKSTELKELFDIVATNLSVFSREVVSQKDVLNDITLRIDAMRSDDSQKKDIIKNISILKPELERLNNGFDSIVLSLNDNFKTIIKTITTLDKTDYLERFADVLSNIEMSSNTVLSAVQMLDKKTGMVEDALNNLATKEDQASTNKKIIDLTAQSHDLANSVYELNNRTLRLESLGDKIDASVNIIASLKSVLEEMDDKNTKSVLDKLNLLQSELSLITNDTRFDQFKLSLEELLKNILDSSVLLDKNIQTSQEWIQSISDTLKALDINLSFTNLVNVISQSKEDVKSYVDESLKGLTNLQDANVTRVLNDISNSAETLGAKLNQTQVSITHLCEKNFVSVFDSIKDVKTIVSQLDDNNTSANNAIFSSITDRLAMFENGLRTSLDAQEKSVVTSTSSLLEQIDNIKNLTGVLDYKLDSSVIETGNVKREFADLKNAVESVLALDFVSVVKDLRVDLYASKQEMVNAVESCETSVSEKVTSDLYTKYELLISKLDNVEDEFKRVQEYSLNDLKTILGNISASIIDVLSYVSEQRTLEANYSLDRAQVDGESLTYLESVKETVELMKVQVESSLQRLQDETLYNLDAVKKSITVSSEDLKKELKFSYSKLLEIQEAYREIKELLNVSSISTAGKYESVMASAEEVKAEFEEKISSLRTVLLEKITNFKEEYTIDNNANAQDLKTMIENYYTRNSKDVFALIDDLKAQMDKFSKESTQSRTATLAKMLNDFIALKEVVNASNSKYSQELAQKVDVILNDFANVKSLLKKVDDDIDNDFTRQLSIIESNFESLVSQVAILFDKSDEALAERIKNEFEQVQVSMQKVMAERLEGYKLKIEETFASLGNNAIEQSEYLKDRIQDINTAMQVVWSEQAKENANQINLMADRLKEVLDENIKLTSADYATLKDNLREYAKNVENNNLVLTQDLKAQLDDITKYIDSVLDLQAQELDTRHEEMLEQFNEQLHSFVSTTQKSIDGLTKVSEEVITNSTLTAGKMDRLSDVVSNNTSLINTLGDVEKEHASELSMKSDGIQNSVNTLLENLEKCADKSDVVSVVQLVNDNKSVLETIKENTASKSDIDFVANKLAENKFLLNGISEVVSDTSRVKDDIAVLSHTANDNASVLSRIEESSGIAASTKDDITALAKLVADNQSYINNIESVITDKIVSVKALTAEISAGELQTLDTYVNNLLEQIELEKQNVKVCKDLIIEFTKKELDLISKNVEKETNSIIAELIEQFEMLRKSQNDEVLSLANRIEDIISSQVYNNIEDLKSYFDIKSDDTVINSKLDNLKIEIGSSVESLTNSLSKLLDSKVFNSAISDFRVANELFISTAVDGINDKIECFINENTQAIADVIDKNNSNIEEKLALFDKKFVETVVDKYEEIKILSNRNNDSFEAIQDSLTDVLYKFTTVKESLNGKIDNLISIIETSSGSTQAGLKELTECFENLRSQISNRSFDEAFQASINKQIANLEDLISEQMETIEDISEICSVSLPDVTELNTLVKSSVLNSLETLIEKIDAQDVEFSVKTELNACKTEIITQFLNVFNQISFVTEQEEILDFIQEKHDALVLLLSHIVTNASETTNLIERNIGALKDDISTINEKINSIISSDGEVDYVYSLQDLETDIAKLRVNLNEIKENDHAQEFSDLISSTNDIYKLVETIKTELPSKSDIDSIAEDIISISTRTNKLILASDESYKTLQDNLQDFKLVINDFDERSKNFIHDAGIDKIDNKLNAINSMMQSGAKTNQVFNQVFEYLAEWVDNASVQINEISDRVESLDEIGQIKSMLADLKAEAEDDSESLELVEALGAVFDKQTKRITSLEAKLDRIIVETTVNKHIDMTPMEDTLNKFLVAIDERMSMQQNKINDLEAKLEGVMELLDNKDTAQLTKKVGGMDRQIAKLNKSIEKIASHVVEKSVK